jgi:hypothetical protein
VSSCLPILSHCPSVPSRFCNFAAIKKDPSTLSILCEKPTHDPRAFWSGQDDTDTSHSHIRDDFGRQHIDEEVGAHASAFSSCQYQP